MGTVRPRQAQMAWQRCAIVAVSGDDVEGAGRDKLERVGAIGLRSRLAGLEETACSACMPEQSGDNLSAFNCSLLAVQPSHSTFALTTMFRIHGCAVRCLVRYGHTSTCP